ncbi:hypothetical protein B0A52_01949 [Exophiala mesophila]|uniref:CENP-V/GFA domain-containing protein n=1 Tax=Exophiala mesophila TaxID=212818 RepID=A0A438NEG2_EXOME|nr:hypothetical protein B0A52_01949 [Exophiala mesophila]
MSTHPSSISGGCLCGSVRYKIAFPDAASWPPNSATCQCTMCRKFTGALISHDLLVHPSQLVEDVTKSPTYKEYQSSESAIRSFCSECGSGLSWRVKGMDDFIVIFLGTVDEEFLIGTKVNGTEETTDMGVKFQREGGLWKDLCNPNMGSLFWNNAIPGVTDHDMGETKFLQSFPQE